MIYIDSCVVLVIVIIIMDLGLLNGDFVMDNRELTLHTTTDGSGVFRDDAGHTAPSDHSGMTTLILRGIR